MGRGPTPQSSSDEIPQGYPNQHDNPLSPPPQDAHMADTDIKPPQSTTRSYVSQSQHDIPPPETYPPEKPAPYPPQPEPVQYPPQQTPVQYPPQQTPVQFPPQQSPVQFPPQQSPVQFPPQQSPVQFPPQQNSYTPQTYNYTNFPNAQPNGIPAGYQTPSKTDGIAIGSQYLAPTQGWSNNNGLFDCAEDPENAIITACFPCITFGQIAEVVDNGQTSCATSGLIYCLIASFIGIPCIMSCSYRTKIRNRYGLMETPAPDWATHCFCEWCALCQEYRELKVRGLDPAIGWQGNMDRNQQQYPMNPPMNQRM